MADPSAKPPLAPEPLQQAASPEQELAAIAASGQEQESGGVALAPAAMHGAKLIVLLGLVARGASFLSQLALGYLLSDDEFGLYATALGLSAMVSVFRDAGVGRLLIVRSSEYDRLARPVMQMAAVFNTLAAVLLVGVGLIAADLKDAPILAWMMLVLAGSVILRSPTIVYRSKAMADMSFGLLWRIDAIGLVVRHGLIVLLALAGLGPISFVLPMLVVSLYEWVALRRATGAAGGPRLSLAFFREIFGTTKWIMLGAAGIALATQGDYLAISLLKPAGILGLYFFGFQFASALAQVVVGSLTNVLMPALVKARTDPQRLHRGFTRALGLLALAMSFVGMFGAVTAPAFIHFVWQGRWDGAIPAAVAVFATQGIRSVSTITIIVAEALGRWRIRAMLIGIDALGTIGSAALGAMLGGVLAISISIAIYRLAWGLVEVTAGAYLANGDWKDIATRLLPPAGIGVAAAAAGIGLAWWLNLPLQSLAGGALAGAIYVVVFAMLALLAARPQLAELRQLRLRG